MLCESPVRDTASEEALQEVLQEEHQRLQEPQLPMLRPMQLWGPQPAPVSEPLEGPTAVCGVWWCGGVVMVWWCGGMVAWWRGGVVVWCGGVVVW